MEEQIINSALDIIQPVMECATIVAAEYTKKCGRSVVTPTDIEYGMKFAARNVTGKQIGSFFPEDTSDDDDAMEIETVDDNDAEPWTRYTGEDPKMLQVNEAVDTWDQWTPESPIEMSIFRALENSQNM